MGVEVPIKEPGTVDSVALATAGRTLDEQVGVDKAKLTAITWILTKWRRNRARSGNDAHSVRRK